MPRASLAPRRRSLHRWLLSACLVVLQAQLLGAQQTAQAQYGARRAALARAIGNGVLVVHAAPEAASNRIGYVPDENLRYLTGLREPGAALVLSVRAGVASERLFVNEREPAAEVWTGVRRGPERTQALTGLTTAPISQLGAVVDSLLGAADTLLVANDTANTSPVGRLLQELRKKGKAHAARSGVRPILALRAKKNPSEIALVATAATITTSGFTSAVGSIVPGAYEYEVEAAITASFRRQGADGPGFPSIVASGDNATTLHYETNDSQLAPSGVVLMDIGAAYHDYSADFTRTLPVTGRFSADQRALYEVVLDAQLAAEKAARPGAKFATLSDSGVAHLARGLARLGLIESPTATYDVAPGEYCARAPDGGCLQWFLYYMHSVGHGVGLDVHDPMSPTLDAGSVFMIELGAYVRRDLPSIIPPTARNRAFLDHVSAAQRRFAGLGMRLEDEYVVDDGEVRWLTRWPRGIAEVEQAMRDAPRPPEMAGERRFPRP